MEEIARGRFHPRYLKTSTSSTRQPCRNRLGKIFHDRVDRLAAYKPPEVSPWQKCGLWLTRTEKAGFGSPTDPHIRAKRPVDPIADYMGDYVNSIVGFARPIYIELKARLLNAQDFEGASFAMYSESYVKPDQLRGLMRARRRGVLAYFFLMYQLNPDKLPAERINEIIAYAPCRYFLVDPLRAEVLRLDKKSLKIKELTGERAAEEVIDLKALPSVVSRFE